MKVSWDDDIPNWMDSPKIHVPNHQPDNILETYYPLAICYIAIEHGHRNSWFTMKHGGFFHSFLYVYQRVLVSLPWTLLVLYCIYIYVQYTYIYMYIYIYSIHIYIYTSMSPRDSWWMLMVCSKAPSSFSHPRKMERLDRIQFFGIETAQQVFLF